MLLTAARQRDGPYTQIPGQEPVQFNMTSYQPENWKFSSKVHQKCVEEKLVNVTTSVGLSKSFSRYNSSNSEYLGQTKSHNHEMSSVNVFIVDSAFDCATSRRADV